MQSQYPNQAYQYYSNLPYSAWPLAPVHSPQLYTPGYKSRVEGPTFPSFVNEDPHEYTMLKMALRNLLQMGDRNLQVSCFARPSQVTLSKTYCIGLRP